MTPDPAIDLASDTFFMGQALRQAQKAYLDGEVPVGAVIVHETSIVARSHNQVETLKDATAHAEMLALTQAQSVFGDWRLTDCDLYVTKEPCPMVCRGDCSLQDSSRDIWLWRRERGSSGRIHQSASASYVEPCERNYARST